MTARSRRIPRREEVLRAILTALERGRADSQRELRSRAVKGLPEGFSLSPERARRIASQSASVRIRVLTRRARRPLEKCPFCGHRLIEAHARDLMGRPTRAGRRCPECGFTMDPGRWKPSRYIFELR